MLSRLTTSTIRSPVPALVAKRALLPCVTAISPHLERFTRSLSTKKEDEENVVILGAAGRDFHDFITYWSTKNNAVVKAFTGTQIPGIEHRKFPSSMCNNDKNNNRYPEGLKIFPEKDLESIVTRFDVDTVALAYSDLSYDIVQSLAARSNAAGCKFVQLPPKYTMVESTKPVVAVCASRTGVGKSQTTRFVARYFRGKGLKVAVVRHPMPYDVNLDSQRCQRYEKLEDMDKYNCTIEEREEYYRHIEDGNLLFAGVDYPMILHEAEQEADVIIWDGGNNDLPFFKPDLHITLVDSLRASDEEHFFPGETNVRMADAILVSKVNSLDNMEKAVEHAEHLKTIVKPHTPIFFGKSIVSAEGDKNQAEALIKNKRVLVVDDGPTLTHGGMPYGAGFVLAKNMGAAEIVDPRPYAKGSLVEVFKKFPHLKNVLPAMGYSEDQIKDLEETIQGVDCDTVIIGTPSDISHLMDLKKPSVATRYELEVVREHEKDFFAILNSFYDRFGEHHGSPKAA